MKKWNTSLSAIADHLLRVTLFISILFGLHPTPNLADVPHPRVLEMVKNGEIKTPYYLEHLQELRAQGVNTPAVLQDGTKPAGPPRNTEVNYNAIVILVDFSDNVSQANPIFFDNLIYGTTAGTVRHYYDEVTYGNLTVVTVNLPSSLGWMRAPQTYAYYVNSNNGFGSYPRNAQKLAEDAIALANPLVNFSQYDNDGDGYVDALFIIHSGPGAEYSGSNNDIWSHKWQTRTPQLVDGVYAYIYSMEPEYWVNPGDMTCGVYAHEMGHSVFGLPDVYDRDGSSRGLGRWSLMAGGSWNGSLGNSPAHPDAWNRYQMGYVTPQNITTDTTSYSLGNIQNNQSLVRLWTNGTQGNQYFLVENRQRVGYDAALPAAGMCIYHVDESVSSQNDNEWYPGHTSSGHYLVALEQADGLWQLEHNSNSGYSGDPFPGSTNNRTFDNSSTPDSKNYNFQNTQIAVRNISNSAMTMQADFEVGNPPQYPDIDVNATSFSFTVQQNNTDNDILTISNLGNATLVWSITEVVPAGWLTENPVSGSIVPGGFQNVTLSVDATGLVTGGYSCNLSIASNDPDENPLNITVNLTVTPGAVNQLPVAVNDTAQVDEDDMVVVDILSNDNDPDGSLDLTSVVITADVAHGSSSINAVTGAVSYTPDPDYFGSDQFSYTVNDNQGATSNVAQVTLTVNSVNDPPVLSNLPDIQFDEDGQFILALNPFVSDVDHDTTQMQFLAQVTSAQSVMPGGKIPVLMVGPNDLLISIDPQTHHAQFSSSTDSAGVFEVVFTVSDDSSASDTDTLQVTVQAVNDPPIISVLPALGFDEDGSLVIPFSFWYPYVSDPDNAVSTLDFEVIDGTEVGVQSGPSGHTLSAPPHWFGANVLQLAINDGLLADTADFNVDVYSVNDPPQISGLPDSLYCREDSSVTLAMWDYVEDIETSDADLTYQFNAPSNTLLLQFDPSTGELQISPEPGFQDMAKLTIQVLDDSSAMAEDSLVVKIEILLNLAENNGQIPTSYFLDQNYPNPFNPTTTIRYGLMKRSDVRIVIYNLLGQEIRTLFRGVKEAGFHSQQWDGRDNYGRTVASSIYIYRLETAENVYTRKMILMK
jgi:immune inhibitor A